MVGGEGIKEGKNSECVKSREGRKDNGDCKGGREAGR